MELEDASANWDDEAFGMRWHSSESTDSEYEYDADALVRKTVCSGLSKSPSKRCTTTLPMSYFNENDARAIG